MSPYARRRRFVLTAALVAVVGACSEDPTQLIVALESDLLIPAELAVLRASVLLGGGRRSSTSRPARRCR